MGLTMRPSNPALAAVARVLASNRDTLVTRWAGWINERMTQAPHIQRPTIERQLTLLVDILIEMAGPLRRQTAQLWFDACQFYGQTAAARGLAAGEIVEEIQHLREMLIRDLSELIAALPARHSMATVLRLNRQVDKGIAHAVVGYTDALVQNLLEQRGTSVAESLPGDDDIQYRLTQFEAELGHLREKSR